MVPMMLIGIKYIAKAIDSVGIGGSAETFVALIMIRKNLPLEWFFGAAELKTEQLS